MFGLNLFLLKLKIEIEKVAEKWNLWVRDQCMSAMFTMEKSTFAATVHKQCITPEMCEKKKKEGHVYCMQL